MTPNAVFGDYGVLFNLKSNVVWRTPELKLNKSYLELFDGNVMEDNDVTLTNFMCCDGDIFN